jgi:beta-lactamase class A
MLQEVIEDLISSVRGTVGFAAHNITTGETVAINALESFPTASMIKIFILFELMQQSQSGRVKLCDRLRLRTEDHIVGSGILTDLDEGCELTLRDYAVLMMSLSDNTATNVLIDLLGLAAINQSMKQAGMEHSALVGKLDWKKVKVSHESFGVATPQEVSRFLERLAKNEFLSPPATAQMLKIMRIQKYIELLRRYLPCSPYASDGKVSVASKGGSFTTVRCGSGIVTTPGAQWSLCVMAKDLLDTRFISENEGAILIARISKALFDAWNRD